MCDGLVGGQVTVLVASCHTNHTSCSLLTNNRQNTCNNQPILLRGEGVRWGGKGGEEHGQGVSAELL